MQTAVWLDQFPGLARLEPTIRAALTDGAQLVKLAEGARIFGPGQAPERFLLLVDGVVRVQQVSESGREIVLYRIVAGESCALTTACLMGYEDYLAEALAETEVTAVAIPRSVFDRLVATSPEFRRFVFTAFSVRVTNLFRIIEEVAFQRLDIRLAHKLLDRASGAHVIETTHQQLAAELGTAREVVSRQLHEFQRRGWIAGTRGCIELRDRDSLRRLAEG